MKILVIIGSLIGIISFGGVKEHKKRPLYFAPPNILQHFSLGYRDFLANLLWLRFIQDADFCSFEKGAPLYKGDIKSCKLGWSYRMVDAITELAPRFKTPYTVSTTVINVFTGDKEGTERILQKGLKQFPNDWKINFYATHFYSIEVKKPQLAAQYAYKAAENGGPYWLYSLAAKKYSETEQLYLGETILKNLLNRGLTDKQKKKVRKHLKELRKKHKKIHWNLDPFPI